MSSRSVTPTLLKTSETGLINAVRCRTASKLSSKLELRMDPIRSDKMFKWHGIVENIPVQIPAIKQLP